VFSHTSSSARRAVGILDARTPKDERNPGVGGGLQAEWRIAPAVALACGTRLTVPFPIAGSTAGLRAAVGARDLRSCRPCPISPQAFVASGVAAGFGRRRSKSTSSWMVQSQSGRLEGSMPGPASCVVALESKKNTGPVRMSMVGVK
jgi:hypothetical protein